MSHRCDKPIDPPDGKTPAVAAEPTVRQPCEKPGMLVVDNDHFVRHMVQMALEHFGFEVRVASNGREAIDFYREHRDEIDVVLLDVQMPGLMGLRPWRPCARSIPKSSPVS